MIKKKDQDETALAPPAGQRLAAATLLVPVHMKTTMLDGTISPYGNPDHEQYELYDEVRFLQIRRTGTKIARNVPWAHVRHTTPLGAE